VKPYYEDSKGILYQGDTLEVLKQLQAMNYPVLDFRPIL